MRSHNVFVYPHGDEGGREPGKMRKSEIDLDKMNHIEVYSDVVCGSGID
jgi:hypothetical protein